MSIQLRTLQALQEYTARLAGERYIRSDVRERLLDLAATSARVLGQNVEPRDVERATKILDEIEAR